MAAFVTFEDVSKVYHSGEIEIRAVDHISFTIEKGEFCVIVGPSGAGKTTVLNMLGGMDACSGGTITVDGTRVSGFNARQLTTYRRHDIGFVFQFYNLVGNLTALENVELAAQICKDPLDAATVLNEVGLSARANNFPGQLSGGEQQRVAIARALANRPHVLLSDEATSALDPRTTKSILSLLAGINRLMGLTIVVVTHEMNVIREICSRVAIIEAGRIVEQGTVKEIFLNPRSKTAREFLAKLPRTGYDEGAGLPRESGKPVAVLTFDGSAAEAPLISQTIKATGADVNILAGAIDSLYVSRVGTLTVQFGGAPQVIAAAMDMIRAHNVQVEVIWNG